MGVTGLWPLLEPVGRRINVEALSNKRLAIGKRSESGFLSAPRRAAPPYRRLPAPRDHPAPLALRP